MGKDEKKNSSFYRNDFLLRLFPHCAGDCRFLRCCFNFMVFTDAILVNVKHYIHYRLFDRGLGTLSIISITGFLIGVWAAKIAEESWGYDPGRVNWDEVIGMFITVIAIPKHWVIYGCGFFIFRLFDIIKPFPVNKMEKLPGGLGIMSDDVIAGIYANIVTQIIFRFIVKLPVTF